MRHFFISLTLSLLLSFNGNAQVKIGGTAVAPVASAVLELDGGSNRGLLLPRMRKLDIDAIVNPAEGLTIYATDEEAVYLRKSLVWVKQSSFSLPHLGVYNSINPILEIINSYDTDVFNGGGIMATSYHSFGVDGITLTGIGVLGIANHPSGVAGKFSNSYNERALVVSGRTGLGTENPLALLHLNGTGIAGATIIIDDDDDPNIQFKKAGINKSYIKQEGNNLVFRPNDQNTSGKVVLQSYNAGGWMFLDAGGDVSVGINPVGFTGTPLGSRMNIRSEAGSTLTLDAPYGNADGPSLDLINKTGNVITELGSLKAAGLNMKLKAIKRMSLEAEATIGLTAFSWTNTYLNAASGMTLSSNGYLDGVLNVTGSVSVGVVNPAATLHLKGTNGYTDIAIIDATDPFIRLRNVGVDKGFIQLVGDDIKTGTVANNDLGKFIVRTNGNDRMFVNPDGRMILGGFTGAAPAGSQMLKIKGGIQATDFTVTSLASWPDYVFADSYHLPSLEETETYIKANKHLPNIPAASVIEKDGFDLGDMQKRMMEKIEELTLHLIEANKEIQLLKKQMAERN